MSGRLPTLAVVGRDRRRRHGDAASCSPPARTSGARSGCSPPPRSAGRTAARARRGARRPALTARGLRRRRRGHVRRARRGLRRVGADRRRRAARSWSTTPARSGWTPTSRWSSPRSTRTQARNRPKGHHRQPQLHDAGDDRRRSAPLHREYGLARAGASPPTRPPPAPARPASTRCYDQIAKVAGDRALGSRAGDVRQAIGDDLGPFPAPLALNVVPWAGSLHGRRLVVARS